MAWQEYQRRPRTHFLSTRGVALAWAAGVSLVMLTAMVLALSRAPAGAADVPGPPPRMTPNPDVATPAAPAMRLQPIACPPEWAKREATCWKAP